MEIDEVLRRRQMTRRFLSEPIPTESLDLVLAAATRAPSAGFAQGIDLLVLSERASRDRFWEAATDAQWRNRRGSSVGLLAAPVVVLPVADPAAYEGRYREDDKLDSLLGGLEASRWPVPYWLVDGAFATMLMLLRATSLGIGALFFQLHGNEATVLEQLGIPNGRRVFGALALGLPAAEQPATSPQRRPRRAFDEVVHRDHW